MRATLAALFAIAAGLAAAAPPALDVPAEVRPVGGYARLTPKTDAVSVVYVALDAADPFPSEELKDGRRFLLPVHGLKEGRYRFVAVAAGKGGEQARAEFVVVVGTAPAPPGPTPPGPAPTPDPPAPIPEPGFRVLFVFEADDLTAYPRGQVNAMRAGEVRDYLAARCAKGADGKTPEWRAYDQHTPMDAAPKLWRDAMARPRASLPWVVVSDGKTGFEGPVPFNPADPADLAPVLTLLKKFGN